VDADADAAIKLYQAAADRFYAPAQYALGTVYAEGAGVTVDPAQAISWFKRALDGGLEQARDQIAALEGQDQGTVSVDMTGFGREGPAVQ
jgi:TPR repeat protein